MHNDAFDGTHCAHHGEGQPLNVSQSSSACHWAFSVYDTVPHGVAKRDPSGCCHVTAARISVHFFEDGRDSRGSW